MNTLRTHWEAWVETVDRWLNGNRHHAFYNGERRGTKPESQVIAQPSRAHLAPRLLALLMLVSAIVMLTFVAAAAIVNSFSARTVTRLTHAKNEQVAAAEYRKARAACQKLAGVQRESCIAEAHAAEERARAMSLIARQDYIKSLRAQTDAAIDAGDRDAIVVEPACNVVARGQGSLCEIQVKPGQIAMPGTNLIPATLRSPQYAIQARPVRPAPSGMRQEAPAPRPTAPARFIQIAQPDNRVVELAWSSRQ